MTLIHKHPLQNPSLAPLGLRSKLSYQRLHYKPSVKFVVFEERMIACFWEKCNRADAVRPLPIEVIIHKILPGMARANRLTAGDFCFDGKPYLTRDLVVLSNAMQWFGTNVGRCFITEPVRNPGKGYHESKEFVVKLEKENKRHNLYAFLAHWCTTRCNSKKHFRLGLDSCIYDHRQVSGRDKAVIDGLMRWLGTAHGRKYLADFRARLAKAHEDADRRSGQFYEKKKRATKVA